LNVAERDALAEVRQISDRIAELESEAARAGLGDHLLARLGSGRGADDYAKYWARETAHTLRRDLAGSESRAVISGRIDVPSLVEDYVSAIPFAARIIDLFTNRRQIDSMAFEFFQQVSPRTNNAAPVPDLAPKPTSGAHRQGRAGPGARRWST
jgi:hypothetical protein